MRERERERDKFAYPEAEAQEIGLTKFEESANRAMQGLLARQGPVACNRADYIAQSAIEYATALWDELEKRDE